MVRQIVPRAARNLLRSPTTSISWVLQELLFLAGQRASCPIAEGWTVRCHPASLTAFRTHLSDSDFQSELASFRRHCFPEMTLLDVGAHFGIFTIAALRFGPAYRVVAVEPSAVASRILSCNVALAGGRQQVEVVRAAVGASSANLRMLTTGPQSTHYMVFTNEPRPDTVEVPQTTIDSLAERMNRPFTHIKIDVEGFEEDVIRGGAAVLKEAAPVVYLELHGSMMRECGRNPAAPLRLLADLGYDQFLAGERPMSVNEAASRELIRLVCLRS